MRPTNIHIHLQYLILKLARPCPLTQHGYPLSGGGASPHLHYTQDVQDIIKKIINVKLQTEMI